MSLTRPLTRPLTRKISRADLTQGFGGSFSPFALNPYLLFDARDSMVGTLENPTLDLNPALPETLDVITATRAGTATYTDVNGLIATAPANTVRVDQTQGAELTPTKFQNIGYTDFANSYWTARGFTKVGVVDGPLGYTGYEFLENNTNSNPSVFINTDLSDGSFQTFGVWLKASSPISIAFATTGSNQTATINITTEWQFFSCTDNYNATTGPFISGFGTITRGSGVRLYAAMPQLEEGTTASDFVANTTGSPKFITGATFGPRVPMILVEPSATNLVTYSEDFSNSYWTKSGTSSVTPNTTISPDGTLNADTISNATGTSTSDTVYRTINPDDVDHTFSAYVKSAGATTMSLITRNGINGVILSQAISLTDEWQRVTLTHNIQNGQLIFGGSDGDFHLWGAQVETGSVATSYIPTSGGNAAARTRAADDLVISGSAFSSFYNQSEGTVYTEFEPRDVSISNKTTLDFSNGTGTERILSLAYSSYHVYVVDGGVEQAHLDGGTYTAGAVNRLAFSYKANNIQVSVGGGAVVSDTSASIPTLDRLQIGASYANSSQLNGHIKRLIYWPYHSDSL